MKAHRNRVARNMTANIAPAQMRARYSASMRKPYSHNPHKPNAQKASAERHPPSVALIWRMNGK